ncbi:protein YIPF5-like [Drosophila kikkawai]|uniref:Protein YIPF n=1 Tax=Drosophila kikkawai TaxID=30033 RepID=A0A6P4J473_DROKI|nr:protein YIPF5-like [Drosophila kikkawai]
MARYGLPNESSSDEDINDYSYETTFSKPLAQSTAYKDLTGTETDNDIDKEPPLLEELGIKPHHIYQKTLVVLNLLSDITDQDILEDTDMAGPLVFCLTLGIFLLLAGKVTFSAIYGIGIMGCIFFNCLLSLMANRIQMTVMMVASMLGYCLLPMVLLSFINIFITIEGTFGIILTIFAVLWCSISASKLLATAFDMDNQQWPIAYLCAMLYGGFALITLY